MLAKKEVEIEWEGKKEVVVVRELTWGEYNEVMEAAIDVYMVGGVPQTKFRYSKYRFELMKRALEKAPFPKEKIAELPRSIAEKIWRAVEELNPLVV